MISKQRSLKDEGEGSSGGYAVRKREYQEKRKSLVASNATQGSKILDLD